MVVANACAKLVRVCNNSTVDWALYGHCNFSSPLTFVPISPGVILGPVT